MNSVVVLGIDNVTISVDFATLSMSIGTIRRGVISRKGIFANRGTVVFDRPSASYTRGYWRGIGERV